MKRDRLLKFVGIALIVVLVVSIPLISSCRSAPPEEVKPIKVGIPCALTGYMAADSIGVEIGKDIAYDEIMAEGGLLGRPLERIYFDIGDFAPETLELAAKQLIGEDKVDVIMGGWNGWGQDVRAFGKYDVPYLEADASDMSIMALQEPGNENCFQFNDSEPAIAVSNWDFLKRLPYEYPNHKLALIGADDAWGRGTVEALKELAEADGWEVVVYEIVPYGTMEWGPMLTKIKATEPALLHVEVASPPDVTALFRQFMLDPTPTVLEWGYSLSQRGFMDEMGDEVNGLLGGTGGYLAYPPPTQEVADWVDRFEAKFGVPLRSANYNLYDAFKMWAEAVRQVGDPSDYAAIIQWMEDTPYQIMPGMRVMKFDERHVLPEKDHPNMWLQVQNGEWYTLYHKVFGDPYVDYQGKSYPFQVPPWIK